MKNIIIFILICFVASCSESELRNVKGVSTGTSSGTEDYRNPFAPKGANLYKRIGESYWIVKYTGEYYILSRTTHAYWVMGSRITPWQAEHAEEWSRK